MLLNATAISFATTNLENGDIIVTPLSKTTLLLHERDSGKETVITMAESNDSIKVSLKEVGNNQETGFFVANKETGEVYSSYTGKTVKVKEEIS